MADYSNHNLCYRRQSHKMRRSLDKSKLEYTVPGLPPPAKLKTGFNIPSIAPKEGEVGVEVLSLLFVLFVDALLSLLLVLLC